ncbi:MAG: hypothetical protein UC300_07540, partial [Prevotella sp.]|nr:hypothetical protein [Prevotella sp.]
TGIARSPSRSSRRQGWQHPSHRALPLSHRAPRASHCTIPDHHRQGRCNGFLYAGGRVGRRRDGHGRLVSVGTRARDIRNVGS